MNHASQPPRPTLRDAVPPVPSPRRPVVPYRDGALVAETLVSGCALAGMLCFTFVLFGTAFDTGLVA